MEFEIKNEGSNSLNEEESSKLDDEAEPETPALRRYDRVRRSIERYGPPNFHFVFVISIINDGHRYVKEAINFEEGKLWKKAMVDEMEALDKNEA